MTARFEHSGSLACIKSRRRTVTSHMDTVTQSQTDPNTNIIINERYIINISVRVYTVIISKYATKINWYAKKISSLRPWNEDQKQSTFNTFKPAQ